MQPETIKLRGGTLAVDFVNSVDWSDDEPIAATDALLEPDALARWGRRLGVPAPADAAELTVARELRGELYVLLAAIAEGREPPAGAAASLMRSYAEAVAAAHLAPARDHAAAPPAPAGARDRAASSGAWRLAWPADDPRRVRFAVAADAVALLADADRVARLHRCPGHDCGWLFLDTSGRRRWCAMETCGSRAKMRALYARRRLQAA